MKKRLLGLTAAVVMMAGMLTACGNAGGSGNDTGVFSSMKTTDFEGNEVDETIFKKNKLTVINAWNTGCSPCVGEIPTLEKLNQEYADKGVEIMGLIYDFQAGISEETRKETEEILGKAEANYRQLLVSEDMDKSKTLQNLQSFPTTFFVDAGGKIVDTIEGASDYEKWKSVIDEELEKVEADAAD